MDNKEKVNKQQLAQEGLKALQEIEQELQMEHIIKDNKIEFKSNKNVYRVRKPTLVEQKEAEKIKRKKYIELVSDDSYLFKKQWIEKYKKKGLDVAKKEKRVRDINFEIKALLLKLAKTAEKKSVDTLVKEVEKLRKEQRDVAIEVADLLNYSIESQLTLFVNSYVTYLVLEKKEGDTWKKVYNSYNDFETSEDEMLLSQAFHYINYLMYGENNELEDTEKTG